MGIPRGKKEISIFLLLAFLMLGVVDTHAFSHVADADEPSHCEVCVLLTTANESAATLDAFYGKEQTKRVIAISTNTLFTPSESSYYCVTLPEQIHNKPPPTLQV